MAPPAKRRRRNAVDDSDDEVEHSRMSNTLSNYLIASPDSPNKARAPTASPSPVKSRPATRTSTSTSASTSTSRVLPRRPQTQKSSTLPSPRKRRDFSDGSEKGKSVDLKTLFSKQSQRIAGSRQPSAPTEEIEDLITDSISEDDEISLLQAATSSLIGQHAKKRARIGGTNSSFQAHPTPHSSDALPSHRFLRPPKPAITAELDNDSRPWSERFGPRNLDELAVHKRKVADVRRWLEDVLSGRMRQRLLILKGPAGSGKTTTLRLLTRDMGCEVLEWKNPANNTAAGFVSSAAKFDEFLGRGSMFGSLDFDDAPSPSPSLSSTPQSSMGVSSRDNNNRQLMLIEEFPNTFSRSSSALTSFRNSILTYLALNTPSLSTFSHQSRKKEAIKPVVLILSETLLTTTSASADSFTAHRLLGPEILRHPSVAMIEFNAIAPTFMTKALELVVQKEARKSGRRRTPGPQVLRQLGELGDIRNAISSLEFLCLKGDRESDWGGKVVFTKQKKGTKDAIRITKSEADSLELISQREASLGIFHAVGKVVYNKRTERSPGDNVENLPRYLAHCSRPKTSEVSIGSLMDETGTDTHTFISALHENYPPSCESTGLMDLSTPMDYIDECIEALSQCDLLCPSRDIFFGGRGTNFTNSRDSGGHVVRQEELAFEVAVRGMLFALPHPVQRKMATGARGSDAFKMFYPTSLKLWRAKEELEGLVDLWSSKLLRGDDAADAKNLTDGAGAFRRPPQQASGLSWMQRQQQTRQTAMNSPTPTPTPTTTKTSNSDIHAAQDDDPAPLLSLGSAARREMLLERLPYMTHIARAARSNNKSTIRLRDLEKVVSFRGIAAPNDESDDDDDEEEERATAAGEAWATDKPLEETTPRRKRSAGVKAGEMTGMLAQKLVISDDDIED